MIRRIQNRGYATLPRIADQSQSEGLFTESLMAAVAESTPDAKDRLRAFLEKRAGKVVKQ
jgi:hypothetical protein